MGQWNSLFNMKTAKTRKTMFLFGSESNLGNYQDNRFYFLSSTLENVDSEEVPFRYMHTKEK